MSDIVILAKDLRKVYRLYSKPAYRFRDMFGVLGNRPGAFSEHAALNGVDLEIMRGEKVAIIGRNGAGKSTFLKLVTNVIQPTSGTLQVEGHVHALLQIGTGFHPDFTGRENVYAYFAQLGISGKEADRRFEEVVDFAEIEEYIDQPIKTYSTGMAVRLMFSASTAISPDLLVLDEVLGVGDAYFAHKSFARMKELCQSAGSTLLLVTHDVYSAANLCERIVWFDRGQVLVDGDGPTVVKAYEDSIRQQEESRLRVRKQQKLASVPATAPASASKDGHLLLEIISKGNRPQACPVYFGAVELLAGGRVVAALPLDADADRAFGALEQSHLQREASCWGDAVTWEGHAARAFLNYGSSFHKVGGVFIAPKADLTGADLSLRLQYWMDEPCGLALHAFVDGRRISIGALPPAAGVWNDVTITVSADVHQNEASFSSDGVQGTGAIMIDDVRMIDALGEESHVARHGQPVSFELQYRIADPNIHERSQVVLTFHRDGIQIASRVIARDLFFDGAAQARGRVRLDMKKVVMADGAYSVSVFVTREGYFDEQQTVFYSLNPGVYCSLNRVLEINVIGGGLIAQGAIFVDQGEWSMDGSLNSVRKD